MSRGPVGRASLPANLISQPLEPQFTKYERNLPHWRLTGATYFVTWRLHATQADLTPNERDLVADAVRHFEGVRHTNFAWVVMNNYAHVLLMPAKDVVLEAILHSWKSFSARELQRRHGRVGRIWGEESFDRIVRDEDEFWVKMRYVEANPGRRWPEIADYRWVWLRPPEEIL